MSMCMYNMYCVSNRFVLHVQSSQYLVQYSRVLSSFRPAEVRATASDHETSPEDYQRSRWHMFVNRRHARRRHALPTRVSARTRSAAHRRTRPCATCPTPRLTSLASCVDTPVPPLSPPGGARAARVGAGAPRAEVRTE